MLSCTSLTFSSGYELSVCSAKFKQVASTSLHVRPLLVMVRHGRNHARGDGAPEASQNRRSAKKAARSAWLQSMEREATSICSTRGARAAHSSRRCLPAAAPPADDPGPGASPCYTCDFINNIFWQTLSACFIGAPICSKYGAASILGLGAISRATQTRQCSC